MHDDRDDLDNNDNHLDNHQIVFSPSRHLRSPSSCSYHDDHWYEHDDHKDAEDKALKCDLEISCSFSSVCRPTSSYLDIYIIIYTPSNIHHHIWIYIFCSFSSVCRPTSS